MPKTTYTSANQLLKAIPTSTEGIFTISAIIGGAYVQIGILNAVAGYFGASHSGALLRTAIIKELADFMETLQNKFK